MKKMLLSWGIAALCLAVLAPEVDAKRLGGGGSSGMRRDLPRQTPDNPNVAPRQNAQGQTPASPNAQQAAPGAAAGAAAAPRRSWMGPIAGLAAGLGLAALMSHLGLGAELANFVMMALLAVVAFVVIRFLLRRFGPSQARPAGLQYANAHAAGGGRDEAPRSWNGGATGSGAGVTNRSMNAVPDLNATHHATTQPAVLMASHPQLPEGFDAIGFARTAKLIFIRMQAANDAGDLNDLRAFTTPEMFAAARLDLQERGSATQKTDVVQLDAEVIDVSQESTQQVVSVRFHGLIREDASGGAAPFDEIWHLVKPVDGSREWAIAGIAPYA